MRRTILIAALTATALFLVAGCGDDAADDGSPTTPAAPETTAATPPPSAPSPAPPATPALLFADNCAGCHGADGSGGNGPDLRGEDDAGGVAEKITSGGGGMPAFGGELTDAQIQELAAYVVSEL